MVSLVRYFWSNTTWQRSKLFCEELNKDGECLETSFNHGKTSLCRQVGKQDMIQTSDDSKYYNEYGGNLFCKAVNLWIFGNCWTMTGLKVPGHINFAARWATHTPEALLGGVFMSPVWISNLSTSQFRKVSMSLSEIRPYIRARKIFEFHLARWASNP